MEPLQPHQPVLVIGMHRSGTTMVTRALADLGVFMGAGLSDNAENELIVALNDWVLLQASATWDEPEPYKRMAAHPEVRDVCASYLRTVLGGPHGVGFTGKANLARGRTALRLPAPWGFKDPRTTYSLDAWLQLWPEARVISVVRHGVDVAASLQVRARKRIARAPERFARRRRSYAVRPLHTRMARTVATLRCADLEGGLGLWDEYATEATRQVAALGSRGIELRYEDVLSDPLGHVRQIAAFCGLPAGEDDLRRAAAPIDGGRALAFTSDPDLPAFAERDDVAAALRRHGYGVPAATGALAG